MGLQRLMAFQLLLFTMRTDYLATDTKSNRITVRKVPVSIVFHVTALKFNNANICNSLSEMFYSGIFADSSPPFHAGAHQIPFRFHGNRQNGYYFSLSHRSTSNAKNSTRANGAIKNRGTPRREKWSVSFCDVFACWPRAMPIHSSQIEGICEIGCNSRIAIRSQLGGIKAFDHPY